MNPNTLQYARFFLLLFRPLSDPTERVELVTALYWIFGAHWGRLGPFPEFLLSLGVPFHVFLVPLNLSHDKKDTFFPD